MIEIGSRNYPNKMDSLQEEEFDEMIKGIKIDIDGNINYEDFIRLMMITSF